MERFLHKQMKLDQYTQPGWEDSADGLFQRDKEYSTSELTVPAGIQLQTKYDTPSPPLNTSGELKGRLDIVPGILRRPQGTSKPGSRHIRLGSVKPVPKLSIPSREPAAEPDSAMLLKAKPVEPISFYPCIEPPANHYIDIAFRRRDGDGSCVCGSIDMQTEHVDI